MPRPPSYIAVIGGGICDARAASAAEEIGRLLAEGGAVLVCGGLGGVMEAACRGASTAGGTTVGILPGSERSDANEHVSIALTTGLGEVRNALIVRASDCVIAIGGEFGTLSEIAFALKTGTPVVGLETWDLAKRGVPVDAVHAAESPAAAADAALLLSLRGEAR